MLLKCARIPGTAKKVGEEDAAVLVNAGYCLSVADIVEDIASAQRHVA